MVKYRIQARQNYRPPLITLLVEKASHPLITIFCPIRDKTILLEPASSKHVPGGFLDISLKYHLVPECLKLEPFQFEKLPSFEKRASIGKFSRIINWGI